MAFSVKTSRRDDQGYVLVTVMWVLLLLVFLGIGAIDRSNVELLIAGNDKFQTTAFHEAEGGISVGTQLLEENIACPGGFSSDVGETFRTIGGAGGTIRVLTLSLAQNATPAGDPIVSALNRDIFYPDTNPNTAPQTNLRIGGRTAMGVGGAIQQAAGYEGAGKGMGGGGGGGLRLYDIYSQYVGDTNSISIIHVQWRHVIGTPGGCNDAAL